MSWTCFGVWDMTRLRVNKSLKQNFMVILTKNQRSKKNKKGMRIRKSRYIELDRTHFYIKKFNMAFSLYRVLEITFYLFKDFSEEAVERLAATEAL